MDKGPATAFGEAVADPLIGGGSGDDGKIGASDLLAGGGIDHHRLDPRAGPQIDQLYRGALDGEVAVTPGEQCQQYRVEIPAAVGQHVFIAGRVFAVTPPLQEPQQF